MAQKSVLDCSSGIKPISGYKEATRNLSSPQPSRLPIPHH